MKCISGKELEDKQLLAYLDHTADQETVLHLEKCAYCLKRATTLAYVHNKLSENLFRITCPSSIELGEYYLHMLPSPKMLLISQHVRTCPHCAHEVEQLRVFLNDPKTTQENNLLEQVKVLIANMISPETKSGALPLKPVFSALRGEEKGPITLEADGIVIVLDVRSSDVERISIQGQVAADDQDIWAGAAVDLYQRNQLEISTTVDDLGAFQLENILPGFKDLHITPKGETLIVVSSFEVSS